MKTFSFIHIVFFILLVFVCKCASAQDYVVTAKGDTLRGKIKMLTYGPDKKLTVKEDNGKKTTLSIFQTRVFVIKGDTFNPVKSERGYSFMKLIKPGYLSLYAFQPENQTSYDGSFLVKKDGAGTEVPNLSFKKIMTRFLADDIALIEKIERGDLGKRELDQIIDEYNQYIEKKSQAQIDKFANQKEKFKGLARWQELEEKVKSKDSFEGRQNALEMIAEIKNKISNSEKIPNFLVEGLKSSLSQTEFKNDLETILKEIN